MLAVCVRLGQQRLEGLKRGEGFGYERLPFRIDDKLIELNCVDGLCLTGVLATNAQKTCSTNRPRRRFHYRVDFVSVAHGLFPFCQRVRVVVSLIVRGRNHLSRRSRLLVLGGKGADGKS